MNAPRLAYLSEVLVRHILLCLWLLLPPVTATAQQEGQSWQELWHELMGDEEEELAEETLEQLQQLSAQPMDINQATDEQLLQLPFLSSQQVMDLRAYLDRYGPMRSMGELRMVRSFSYRQLQLLPYFIYIGASEAQPQHPSWKQLATHGRHEVMSTLRLPFYSRKGDENGYLGYPYRHELRYEVSFGNYAKAGFLGAQDAGEPFLASGNRWGYDYYSYYIQLKKMRALEQLVVGKYKQSAGMGLVLGSGFSMGKLATLQSLGRQKGTLRPHASRSEGYYLQGAAAVLRLSKPLTLTLLASHRPLDATLNADGTAATIITSGYHRTPKEMEKKANMTQTDAGLHLQARLAPFHLGLTACYTHLNRPLQPSASSLFRRYYPRGSNFLNASADYGYRHHRYVFQGETAIDAHGHVATINALSYQAAGGFGLMALQRFYSYRYEALHAHSLSEGGRVQNESGVLLGVTWQPLGELFLQAYADYAYFPWARYQAPPASDAVDMLCSAVYTRRHWTLKARYRWHRRQLNADGRPRDDHRCRLSLCHASDGGWSLTTQGDCVFTGGDTPQQGFMVSETAAWQHRSLLLHLTAACFDTDGYESRVYLYERQLAHSYGFPSYYGQGMRLMLMARANLGRYWQLAMRLGHTRYFDRDVIGSGLQQISAPRATDLEIQLRFLLH